MPRCVSLRQANLQEADLKNANLYGVDLRDSHLEGADLRGAYLAAADLRGATADAHTTKWPHHIDPAALGVVITQSPTN